MKSSVWFYMGLVLISGGREKAGFRLFTPGEEAQVVRGYRG